MIQFILGGLALLVGCCILRGLFESERADAFVIGFLILLVWALFSIGLALGAGIHFALSVRTP
jgi:hypothetical protein